MKSTTNRRIALFGALALASSASAQEPRRLLEVESVPLELATALAATGGFGGEPQVLVGSMPEWIASRLVVPAGGRIVGSAFLGTTVVGVVSVGGAPDSAISDLRTPLAQRGWKNPPAPPIYPGGGFRPAPASAIVNPTRLNLCGDQQLLSVTAIRRRGGGGSDITYRITAAPTYSICRPPELPQQQVRSPYPTLYNPVESVDARMNNECNSNYGGSGTSTILRTAMTSDAILDHYARQVQDSGWTTNNANTTIVGRSWTRTDSAGAQMEMTLTVGASARDASCREVNLQVRTFRKP